MVKKTAGSFYEKELQKPSQKNLEQKNYLKEKVINCMSNGKNKIIHLAVALIKNTLNKIPSKAISLYKIESILS